VQSHTLFRELVVPEIVKKDKPILFVVIDNLRYDQWKTFESEVSNYYKLKKEVPYFSILPTATQYARNAIFSDTTGNGKAVSAILEKRSRRRRKTYMKLSFISATKTPRTEHQRRLF
jgi:hypothetical protein